ncbi:hypothetical protein DFP91_5287 [Pseudorhodoplanes sinuspersici]|nr:hypothetical protein DFP91_5287 [Pseudorhodoplanes sinuspersici]
MPPLSILELVRVMEAVDAHGPLNNARDVAALAVRLGCNCVWVAEHHTICVALSVPQPRLYWFALPRVGRDKG